MNPDDSTQKNQPNINPMRPADIAQESSQDVPAMSSGVAQLQNPIPAHPDTLNNSAEQVSKNNRALSKIGLILLVITAMGILVVAFGFIKGWLFEDETDPCPVTVQSEVSDGLTIEEALENGVLGNIGSGALEAIGPYTVPAGEYGQKVYVRVKNLASEAVTFTLRVDASPISAEYVGEVAVEPSTTSVSYVDIPIAIAGTQPDGDYTIHTTLYYSGTEAASTDIHVTLRTFTDEDIKVLHELIEKGDEYLSETVMDEYEDILKAMNE